MPEPVSIQFTPGSLVALNICLALIMFGVALNVKVSHFKGLLSQKKAVITGLLSQFVLLPALTALLVIFIPMSKEMALGMILVAACPGGNVSNFYSMIARGNVALSVTLTAFSSLLAFIVTPLNFFLWVSLIPSLSHEVTTFSVDLPSLMLNMMLILLLPLVVGMEFAKKFPLWSVQIGKPLRILSMLILAGFIGVALFNNWQAFALYIGNVFWVVLLHNTIALSSGFFLSWLLKNSDQVNRTIAIETGIQNSGLALLIIFTFFEGNTTMALVAAWWGVWHLVGGLGFAGLMRSRDNTLQRSAG